MVVSYLGNLESPGASCSFTGTYDQSNVTDPMLSHLWDFGGPTRTVLPLEGSPAVGDEERTGCQDLDQRGLDRCATQIGGGYTVENPLKSTHWSARCTGDDNVFHGQVLSIFCSCIPNGNE